MSTYAGVGKLRILAATAAPLITLPPVGLLLLLAAPLSG